MRSLISAILLTQLIQPIRADDAVLRYVPKQADFTLVIEDPRRLVEAITTFEPLRELAAFPAIREQLGSTNTRRAVRLLEYYEKALGIPWPEMLDRLAGGGATLAAKFEGDSSPALFVIRAKDEALLHRAFGLVRKVVGEELERNGETFRVKEAIYRGFTGYQFGKDLAVAVAGPMLFISNKGEGVKAALDLYVNGSQESLAGAGLTADAKKMLPASPLAWLWINLDKAHASSEGQAAYRYPRGDPFQLLLLQGILDVVGKSPFVAAALNRTDAGFRATIRMAAGRDASPKGLALHLPPDGQPGSLPLLEPKNVLASMSFYLDLGKLWTEKDKLLEEQLRKGVEDGEKNLGRFLAGRKFSEILTAIGPHHRVVVAANSKPPYSIKPGQPQPGYAVVSDLRNPSFAEAMNAVLRATALIVGANARMRMSEEKLGDVKLVCYRFPEDGKLAGDEENNRFNFSPCFARVGNSFLAASTAELGREMVGLLQQPPGSGQSPTTKMRIYSAGGSELLRAFEDQLLTATILDRAVPVAQAKVEAQALVQWLRGLGKVDVDVNYGASDFRYEIELRGK